MKDAETSPLHQIPYHLRVREVEADVVAAATTDAETSP